MTNSLLNITRWLKDSIIITDLENIVHFNYENEHTVHEKAYLWSEQLRIIAIHAMYKKEQLNFDVRSI